MSFLWSKCIGLRNSINKSTWAKLEHYRSEVSEIWKADIWRSRHICFLIYWWSKRPKREGNWSKGRQRERELLLDIPYGKSKSFIDFSNTTRWYLVIFQIAIMLAFHWKLCVLHIILACEKLFPLSHKDICKILVGEGTERLHMNFFLSLFTFQQDYFFKDNKYTKSEKGQLLCFFFNKQWQKQKIAWLIFFFPLC